MASGDLLLLSARWYVTHTGLIRLAARRRCREFRFNRFRNSPMQQIADMHSRRLSTSRAHAKDLSATEMPIPPMSPSLSTAPRCAWPKPAPSTALCAKPTASASARSRRSVPWPNRSEPSRESKKLPPQPANGNGTTAAQRFAIDSARSFASTSSIPTWSRPTPPTSAA